ncbi:MAG: nickel-dependent hydrogenase large subunit, partial [Gammaproteobacteria bacterium]|nr:nickel-dependent hydrogenase large subunit [Gammaproteobacteria bacterium]
MNGDVLLLAELTTTGAARHDGFIPVEVGEDQWQALARGCASGRTDLLALWADRDSVLMALRDPRDGLRVVAALRCTDGGYASVGRWHPPAIRLERTLRDLSGPRPGGLVDERPWLDHGRWPSPPPGRAGDERVARDYRFLPVEGEGLHQIAVGPVHAGVIEPGHFRFSANGEAVVRLEQRLGYVHKGIESLLNGKSLEQAAAIIARVSGDSTVACSYAFALAVEALFEIAVPPRATLLRAIMAELERIAHHVSDFGAICNDASVVAINAHCALLRERCLQLCARCFGHRMMMDCVVPGGASVDLDSPGADLIKRFVEHCRTSFGQLYTLYDQTTSLQDRTVATGIVSASLAQRFGAGGFVGRGAGRDFDCRRDCPYPPYPSLRFEVVTRDSGDVDARARVRAEEVTQSLDLLEQLLDGLRPGAVRAEGYVPRAGESIGMTEAFRGDLLVALRTDQDGRVGRCHVRDASCFQWPLL